MIKSPLFQIAGIVAILAIIVGGLRFTYNAGWNAHVLADVKQDLLDKKAQTELIASIQEDFDKRFAVVSQENSSLEKTLQEVQNEVQIVDVPGCGVPADSLMRLDALR